MYKGGDMVGIRSAVELSHFCACTMQMQRILVQVTLRFMPFPWEN